LLLSVVVFVALRLRATKEQQNNDKTGVIIAKYQNFFHKPQNIDLQSLVSQ
jgi:hypothetical protein